MQSKVFDKNVRYIVFPTNGNTELGEFLAKRAKELGYTEMSEQGREHSVTLCNDGKIRYTPYPENLISGHIYGDFRTFLTTNEYRYEDPIMINEHRVIFNKDGSLTIGCTTVNKETIDKIVEKIRNCDY